MPVSAMMPRAIQRSRPTSAGHGIGMAIDVYRKEAFKEFVRRVRKAVGGNDNSASHATRVAGTKNFKLEYAPHISDGDHPRNLSRTSNDARAAESPGPARTTRAGTDRPAEIRPLRREHVRQGPPLA